VTRVFLTALQFVAVIMVEYLQLFKGSRTSWVLLGFCFFGAFLN